MAKRENFYRRDPMEALNGMTGLTLEEKGVYNVVLDLLYSTWRPLENNPAFIAGWCGCAVQKLNPIIRRLLEKEKLITFEEGGRVYLSNPAFERERQDVKGDAKTRSGRAEVQRTQEKLGRSQENHPTSQTGSGEKQPVTALDKTRQDQKDANASIVFAEPKTEPVKSRSKPTVGPAEFEAAWAAYPHIEGRSSKPNALAEWKKLDPDIRSGLVAAIGRFIPKVAQAHGDRGAPDMARWLRDGKHLNWQGVDPAASAPAAVFDGPPEIRSWAAERLTEGYARSYIDPSGWDAGNRALLAANPFAEGRLKRDLAEICERWKFTVRQGEVCPPVPSNDLFQQGVA